jgi:alpha-glucosidase
VPIVDPGVKVDAAYGVYRDGRARDAFCRNADGSPFHLLVWPKRSALPDFMRPDVQAWWGEQHRPLLDAGVAGIWNDMNEPAGWAREIRVGKLILPWKRQDLSRVVQAEPAAAHARPRRSDPYDDDAPDEDPLPRVPHEHVRNLYGHLQCRATREFLERADAERRPFVLTRSGFAGIQRWAAMWTGDTMSRWSHLRLSMPMLLNLSLSGVAFCGADIGGFAGPCTPELFARWMQIGALYPLARTHSMWLKPRQEPWRFGARVEAIARDALRLRMRLLPYLYGLFHEAAETGAPIWRPLFFEFPDDPESAAIDDQVLIGPALLAAPVLERGAREREVYLPPGAWIAWHDDARFVGPRRVRVPAPLERLPLFVRAGAVVPTRSPTEHAGATPDEPLVLEVFPGCDADGVLVEDDGESTAYQRGAVARTALRLRRTGRLRLEIGRREGDYTLPRRPARVVFRAAAPPRAVWFDAQPLPEGPGLPGWRATGGRVEVRFEDDGRAHSLEIDPAP